MAHIRPYNSTDWTAVERIMQEGIDTGVATFETQPKPQKKWETESIPETQLVAVGENEEVLGWTVLWPVSDRCTYAGVAEVSVYVSASAQGQGIGKLLLTKLIEKSEEIGIWSIQAGIFEDNPGSMALHLSCGFRLVGYREKIGKLHGIWKNNQQFERRSKKVGID
ncbi:MAG: N-acetyltransferase family protein [Kordiimonas sp.]